MLLVTFSMYRTSLLAKLYQKYLSDIKQGVNLIAKLGATYEVLCV